jgi:hypothetical protein
MGLGAQAAFRQEQLTDPHHFTKKKGVPKHALLILIDAFHRFAG